MRYLKIFLLVLSMCYNADISAQQAIAPSIKWKIATQFPSENGKDISIGVAGPLTGVHNGVIVVGGGANFPDAMPWDGGKKKYHNEIFVLQQKKKDKFHWLDTKVFKLPFNTAYGANVSTNQGIAYLGGENENGISKAAFLVKWNKQSQEIEIDNLPDLPIATTNASATINKNIIYIAGGETANAVSDNFYSLDLSHISEGWKQLPDLPHAVSSAILVVQSNGENDKIYLLGGRKKNTNSVSSFYNSVYAFDVETKVWEEKKSIPSPKAAGTGIAMGKNFILLFGGDEGTTFNKVESLLFAIGNEKNEIKKQELITQKNKIQVAHPGFKPDVLLYNTLTNEWQKLADIPFAVPATTTAVLWNNCVFIPSGEIKAGIRSPQILLGKFKRNIHD